MKLLATLGLLLLLTTLTRAAPTGTKSYKGCSYKGKSYETMDVASHENGCAALQCQFGKMVFVNESCGKELDNYCHPVGASFEHKGNIYHCFKEDDYEETRFKMEITVAIFSECTAESKTFLHLETFYLSDECRRYQCVDGKLVVLSHYCGKEIDGNCHLVGEWFVKDDFYYTCNRHVISEEDVVYENIVIENPASTRGCTFRGTKQSNLGFFKTEGECRIRQCQNGKILLLRPACVFAKDQSCRDINEQFGYQTDTFKCQGESTEKGYAYSISRVNKKYAACKLGEKIYQNMDYFIMQDGCRVRQCLSGATNLIKAGCTTTNDKICHPLNSIWKTGSFMYKCIYEEDCYKIVVLDDDGNVIVSKKPLSEPEKPYDLDNGCPVMADIYFAIDSSGSIGRKNYDLMLNFSIMITRAFPIGPEDVRFGCIIFSGNTVHIFGLNTFDKREDIEKKLTAAPFLWNITETHKAFNDIYEGDYFSPANGGRENADDIVIVMTDGNSTYTPDTVAAANRVKATGAEILVVAIGDINQVELVGMASRPGNIFKIKGFDLLYSLRVNVSRRACSAPDDEPVEPPKPIVESCKTQLSDIIMVVDASGSIGGTHFAKGLEFTIDIIQSLNVGVNAVRLGYLTFSASVVKHFQLSTFYDKDDIVKAVRGCQLLKYNTRTDKALDLIRTGEMFSPANGGRPGANRVVVMLTDGRSDNTTKTVLAALNLRRENVIILAVAIARAKIQELVEITGNEANVFRAANYDLLNFILALVAERVCNATIEAVPSIPPPPKCETFHVSPCEHICTNVPTGINCSCQPGYVTKLDDPSDCEDFNECLSSPCEHTCVNTAGGYYCTCKAGYAASPSDTHICQDVDECLEKLCEQGCNNTLGGYVCLCQSGYTINQTDPTQCDDINECNLNVCQQKCTNSEGSYACDCEHGYTVSYKNSQQCDDVDECESDPCEQMCTNARGCYSCSCHMGYVISKSSPNKCDDVDECVSKPCQHNCTNTAGSYRCSCKAGFAVNAADPTKCQDKDECASGPCQHICRNNEGGYECSCRPGYVVKPSDPSKCDDVNECLRKICDQDCTNNVGSYECLCRAGYIVNSANPDKCDDVNECDKMPCQQNCTNTVGSYKCSSDPGYKVSAADSPQCEDIDGCENSTCEHICSNKTGKFECSCRSGYQANAQNSSKCDDVDECADEPCQQACTNNPGSYECSCHPGYKVSSSNHAECEDVDECLSKPCEHICTNEPGRYACSCNDGFAVSAVDPSKCQDIDECATGLLCQHRCNNEVGSYKCSCDPGYTVSLSDDSKCDDIDECVSFPCEQDCTNSPGSYACSCKEGYEINPTDSFKCNALNKCDANPCEHICKGDAFDYTCSCNSGFRISASNLNKCDDINECQEQKPCGKGTCTNTLGSFSCVCASGFYVNGSSGCCVDIDECAAAGPPVCEQRCVNTGGSYRCACNDGFALAKEDSTKCKEIIKCQSIADIIFVVDTSESIGIENFALQILFIKRITQHFPLGPKQFRFGAIRFSNGVSKAFDLKTYSDYNSLAKGVDAILYTRGETYTNRALDVVRKDNLFSTPNGGRDEAPNIVIVLTDGASTVPELTLESAQALKETGCHIVSFGIGNKISLGELQSIASNNKSVITTSGFNTLDFMENYLADITCDFGLKADVSIAK